MSGNNNRVWFLSNPSEEESLSKEEYQKKLAEIICTGIKEYFGEK